ncbi:MAG: four helix bundle protein [Candidatus Doudnabacteria bacterium]|nr:four helix bundle protein [Candidatus Doudnabacteria bacterium]
MYESGNFQSYKDLIVWQKSLELAHLIYDATKQLPKSELFGLVSQMQRAAVSIPSNIAEGYDRNNPGEFRQFLGIAYGSSAELETQLLLCIREYPSVGYTQATEKLSEVRKMLKSLIQKHKNR